MSAPAATVYLAARYSRRVELCGYAAELEAAGYRVTSRWLLGNHQAENDQLHRGAEAERFAAEDLADVDDADALVSFGEEPRTTNSRGGRHVEFGYALALRKPVLVVGPREHVFTCLVDQTGSWAGVLPWLATAVTACTASTWTRAVRPTTAGTSRSLITRGALERSRFRSAGRPARTAGGSVSDDGPHLILAAFWLDEPDTDAVADALRCKDFPPPEGWPRGCVVSFRREVATSPGFQRDLARFDLAELNDWPRAPLARPGVP